jgi:hypothetical protein
MKNLILFMFLSLGTFSKSQTLDLKFIGTGLNDLQVNGQFSLSTSTTLVIIIDKVNQNIKGVLTDTFKYSIDNGITWIINNLTIDPRDDSETLLPLLCSDRNWVIGYSGVKINFVNKIGHTSGDKWTVKLKPQSSSLNLSGIIKYNNNNFIRVQDSGGLVIGKNSGDGGKTFDYNLGGSGFTTQPITVSPTSLVTNVPYLVVHYRRGSTSFTRLIGNNTIVSTTVNNSWNLALIAGNVSLRMGSYDQPDNNFNNSFAGGVYEHMLFKYALTDQQIFQIEGYLAWKWGLQASLPATHPYYRIRP